MALLYVRVETHGALVGKILRDGEAVRVPVATEKRQKNKKIKKMRKHQISSAWIIAKIYADNVFFKIVVVVVFTLKPVLTSIQYLLFLTL